MKLWRSFAESKRFHSPMESERAEPMLGSCKPAESTEDSFACPWSSPHVSHMFHIQEFLLKISPG